MIIKYFLEREKPTFKVETRKLRYKVTCYLLINDVLYKHNHLFLYLKYLEREKIEYMLRETH